MAHLPVSLTACSLVGECIVSSAVSLAMAESHWTIENCKKLAPRKTRNAVRDRGVDFVAREGAMSECGGHSWIWAA